MLDTIPFGLNGNTPEYILHVVKGDAFNSFPITILNHILIFLLCNTMMQSIWIIYFLKHYTTLTTILCLTVKSGNVHREKVSCSHQHLQWSQHVSVSTRHQSHWHWDREYDQPQLQCALLHHVGGSLWGLHDIPWQQISNCILGYSLDFDMCNKTKSKSKWPPWLCFCTKLTLYPPPCKDNRLHIHIYIHFHRSRIHENHYGCKYVPTSCALSSLSLIPKPRLLKNTSQICLHHNSTWILERAHTNIICHDLLVTQEAVDLVQEFETNHWHDSDLLSKQNESLDWAEFLYFILETNLVQVFILCVGTQSWNLLLLLTRQHHTWDQIQKYTKVLQYFNLWTQFENLYLAIVTGCIKSRTRTCFKLLNPLFVEFHVDYRVGKFWYTYLYLDHNMVKREIKGLNTIVNVNGVNYMFDQASSTMWCSTHSCMCVGFGAKVAMLPWQKDFQTGIVMIGIDWAPGSMCAQTFLTAGTDVAMTALIGGKLAIMIPLYPDCVWGVDGR